MKIGLIYVVPLKASVDRYYRVGVAFVFRDPGPAVHLNF